MTESRECGILLKYRENGLTFGFALNQLKYLLIGRVITIFLCFYLASIMPVSELLFMLAAGIFVGSIAQDLAWHWKLVKAWPLTLEITDWEKVEALANRQN